MSDLVWLKSSYSSGAEATDGPRLIFSPAAWAGLLTPVDHDAPA